MSATVADVVERHRNEGRWFTAGCVRSFVRDHGDGPAVVLLHDGPASSFLYRKVAPELAARGLRAIAFDFPGLGLADRPRDFDYTWSGLAAWLATAIDTLGSSPAIWSCTTSVARSDSSGQSAIRVVSSR